MNFFRRMRHIFAGILRELADQNAYRRHLERCGREHSAAEWKHFTDHRFRTKYSQGRCC
jgi:hypothetical protein